jgi:hypothetical protein
LLKTSIYIQIVIRWASIHRLSICIIDLPTTDDNTCYGKTLRVMVGMIDIIVLPGFADTTGSRQRFTNRAIK